MLCRDIEDLHQRYQERKRRCEELVSQLAESTRPLFCQIEVIVTQSIGLLSYTFLRSTKKEDIVVHIAARVHRLLHLWLLSAVEPCRCSWYSIAFTVQFSITNSSLKEVSLLS